MVTRRVWLKELCIAHLLDIPMQDWNVKTGEIFGLQQQYTKTKQTNKQNEIQWVKNQTVFGYVSGLVKQTNDSEKTKGEISPPPT